MPNPSDLSTFPYIIQLRRMNGSIYRTLYSAGDTSLTSESVEALRSQYYGQLNQWLVSTPRYISPVCMNQTPEWFPRLPTTRPSLISTGPRTPRPSAPSTPSASAPTRP